MCLFIKENRINVRCEFIYKSNCTNKVYRCLIYTVRRDVLSDVFVQFIYLLVHFFYLPGLFRNLRGFFWAHAPSKQLFSQQTLEFNGDVFFNISSGNFFLAILKDVNFNRTSLFVRSVRSHVYIYESSGKLHQGNSGSL